MIFSRFFSPAHTSSDPQKRLQAIAGLSVSKPAERSALHELAFNDSNSDVSLAALEKLDSFPLWMKMSQTARDEKIRRRAVARVESAIIDADSADISADDQYEYVLKQAPAELARKLLESPRRETLTDAQIFALLEKIGRSDYTREFFGVFASVPMQMRIAEQCDDAVLLGRLLKKTDDAQVQTFIQDKLSALQEAAEKPARTEQAYTLVLSKLQAVTDRFDYEDVDARLQACAEELDALSADLPVLAENVVATITEKQTRLLARAEQHRDRLKVDWDAQQAERALQQEWLSFKAALSAAEEKVAWLFNERLSEATLSDVESVNDAVRELEGKADSFAQLKPAGERQALADTINERAGKLDAFSAQQQIAIRLNAVISDAERAAADAGGAENIDDEMWRSLAGRWAEHKELLFPVADALKQRWNVLSKAKKREQTQRRVAQDNTLKQVRRLSSVVSNLIETGRFRAAMARFTELQALYDALGETNRLSVERKYGQLTEEIARLEGWQTYLAAPRKPAMLEEARQLAATAPSDIAARAAAIKQLRKQWQSLATSQDKDEADIAFDEALEQAFAPCRAHYAEQEQQRLAAQQKREGLISELSSLTPACNDPASLAKQLDKLRQRWRDAGAVDKPVYEALKKRWDTALAPLSDSVNQWFNDNRVRKQAIIEQARSPASQEDSASVSEQAKALQVEWKNTGHAGKRHESRLWQTFKSINDELFARVKEQREAVAQEENAQLNTLLEQVKVAGKSVKQHPEEMDAALVPVVEAMQTLDAKKQAVVQQRIDRLRKNAQQQVQEQALDDRKTAMLSLHDVLKSWLANDALPVDSDAWASLPKAWRNALTGQSVADKSRDWYTHVLELKLNIDAAPSLQAERRNVQLALMTAKLEKGDDISFSEALCAWLGHGKPGDAEFRRLLNIIGKVQENAVLLKEVV